MVCLQRHLGCSSGHLDSCLSSSEADQNMREQKTHNGHQYFSCLRKLMTENAAVLTSTALISYCKITLCCQCVHGWVKVKEVSDNSLSSLSRVGKCTSAVPNGTAPFSTFAWQWQRDPPAEQLQPLLASRPFCSHSAHRSIFLRSGFLLC